MTNAQLSTSFQLAERPKKRVLFDDLASKRIFDTSSPPGESDKWEKRRVVLHDKQRPRGQLAREALDRQHKARIERKLSPEAVTTRLCISPPSRRPEDCPESSPAYWCEMLNDTEYQAKVDAALEARRKTSESAYTVDDSDEDEEDDDGTASDDEEWDSMQFSAKPYRKYLGHSIHGVDKRPLCSSYFLSSLSPDPNIEICLPPEHKTLAAYVEETKVAVDKTVVGYNDHLGCAKVNGETRQSIRGIEERCDKLKKEIEGYTMVPGVSKRMGICAQHRDWEYLGESIETLAREVGTRMATRSKCDGNGQVDEAEEEYEED